MSLSEKQRWELAEKDAEDAIRRAQKLQLVIWGDGARAAGETIRLADLIVQCRRLRE